jgi:hypothetical protein
VLWNEHGNASCINYSEKEDIEGSNYKAYFLWTVTACSAVDM